MGHLGSPAALGHPVGQPRSRGAVPALDRQRRRNQERLEADRGTGAGLRLRLRRPRRGGVHRGGTLRAQDRQHPVHHDRASSSCRTSRASTRSALFLPHRQAPQPQVGHRLPHQVRGSQVQVPGRAARLRQLLDAHRRRARLLRAGRRRQPPVPRRRHPPAAQRAPGAAADRFLRRGRATPIRRSTRIARRSPRRLPEKLEKEFTQLGFLLEDFRIQGTSFDDDTMRRINRIADISAEAQAANAAGVSYAQLQQLAALRDAAKNPGAGGVGMAMAVGMGMAGAVVPPARRPRRPRRPTTWRPSSRSSSSSSTST